MINFRELSTDGVQFEQLIRELLIRENYSINWTGIGPDGGRDLVLTEELNGSLSKKERKWIISCKHFANAGKTGRSVGLDDLGNLILDCQAINAEGYILACSTYPSSSVVRRLEEIEDNNKIFTRIWDGIEIEKRLLTPNTFGLIHTFFPTSSKEYKWKIYNAYSPSFWSASYKDYFFYLSSRDANIYPDLKSIETIIDIMERIDINVDRKSTEHNHILRPRSIFYDDKHCTHRVYLDYLLPHGTKKELIIKPDEIQDLLFNAFIKTDHKDINVPDWDIKYVEVSFHNDHYHSDHKDFYEPYIQNYNSGSPRSRLYSNYNY